MQCTTNSAIGSIRNHLFAKKSEPFALPISYIYIYTPMEYPLPMELQCKILSYLNSNTYLAIKLPETIKCCLGQFTFFIKYCPDARHNLEWLKLSISDNNVIGVRVKSERLGFLHQFIYQNNMVYITLYVHKPGLPMCTKYNNYQVKAMNKFIEFLDKLVVMFPE